jgi:hypothetical protein
MLSLRIALVGVFLAMTGPESAAARSLDRTIVRVHCAGEMLAGAQLQGLCRNIVQSLMQVIPQAAPRLVSADEWQPGRPNDISIRLEMSETSGKLVWQKGPMGEFHTGPGIPFDATRAGKPECLKKFADKLVDGTSEALAQTLK